MRKRDSNESGNKYSGQGNLRGLEQSSFGGSGTVLVYAIAVLYMVLGLAFIFIPQLQAIHLCYLFAICLILMGVIKIAEYFIQESYQNSAQYGFSIGVITLILGVCVIIRVQQFVDVFHIFLGVGILLTAVIKLQHALDLRALKDNGYLWVLVVAILMILAAAIVLFDPFSQPETQNLVTYIVMTADGFLTFVTTTYLLVRIRQRNRDLRRKDAGIKEIEDTQSYDKEGSGDGGSHADL